MGTTATYLLPYPELDEADNVPADVRELAERLDLVLPTFQEVAEYGQPNGYAPLDATGKVPAAYLPPAASQIVVVRKATTKDIVNSASPADAFNGELIVPANALTQTGRAFVIAGGTYLNNTGGNKSLTFQVTLAGSTLWLPNVFNVSANANRRTWRLALDLLGLDATHVMMSGLFVMGDPAALASTGEGGISTTPGPQGAIQQNTMTIAGYASPMTLAWNITHSATSAQLSFKLYQARMEIYG